MEQQPQNPQPRSREFLVAELKRKANEPSRDFQAWWWSLTKRERLILMEPEEG